MSRSPSSLRLWLRVKSNLSPRGQWRSHKLPNGIEDDLELGVVFLLHVVDLAGKFARELTISRMRTKARTTKIAALIATGVLSTLAAIMAPYSVNT